MLKKENPSTRVSCGVHSAFARQCGLIASNLQLAWGIKTKLTCAIALFQDLTVAIFSSYCTKYSAHKLK